MGVEARLQEFIEKSLIHAKDVSAVGQDESLLDSGLLDSASIFELVAFVETQFQIDIGDEEIVPGNFETVRQLAAFIEGKQGDAKRSG